MIDFIILIIDVLAIFGFSLVYRKQIKESLKVIVMLSVLIPILVFIIKATLIAINNLDNYWILISDQLVTLILAIFAGAITSKITNPLYDLIKELIRRIKGII